MWLDVTVTTGETGVMTVQVTDLTPVESKPFEDFTGVRDFRYNCGFLEVTYIFDVCLNLYKNSRRNLGSV